MGKRGPKATGRTGVILSTRIESDLRHRLDRAAKASGKTLSWEVQRRLERSFGDDSDLQDRFGGRRAYGLLRAIGAVMSPSGETAFAVKNFRPGGDGAWLSDPYAYDQAAQAAIAVLEAMRPPGAIEVPKHFANAPEGAEKTFGVLNSVLHHLGPAMAKTIVQEIASVGDVKLSQELVRKPRAIARRIADDLGDVAQRARQKKKP